MTCQLIILCNLLRKLQCEDLQLSSDELNLFGLFNTFSVEISHWNPTPQALGSEFDGHPSFFDIL